MYMNLKYVNLSQILKDHLDLHSYPTVKYSYLVLTGFGETQPITLILKLKPENV